MKPKFFFKVPERKKQNFKIISFPQNVFLDNTSTLWTKVRTTFRKMFFAVSTRNRNFCGYFELLTRETILWTRKLKFWQLRYFSFTPRQKKLFIIPQRKKNLQETTFFFKMLLWTIQVHNWQVCQKFSHCVFCCTYRKY